MITLCVTNFVIICHFVISGQSISQQKSSGGSPQGVPPPTARIFGRNGGVPNGNPPYGALQTETCGVMPAQLHQPSEPARQCSRTCAAHRRPCYNNARRHAPQPTGPKPHQHPLDLAQCPTDPAIQNHCEHRLHPPRPQRRQQPAQDHPQIGGYRLRLCQGWG